MTMLNVGTGAWRSAGASSPTGSSGSPSPTASAPSTRPRSTAPSPTSRSGSRPARGPQGNLPGHQGHAHHVAQEMIEMARPAAGDPGDRLHRPLLHPRPRRRSQPRRRHQPGQEPGVQGDGRGDPEVGQGQVHRLLDPPQGPRPDHPGGGRGRDRRRDHAPVHPLARQGLPAEQGARRLPSKGIGLISMKQIAGQFFGDGPRGTSSTTWSAGCRCSPRRS